MKFRSILVITIPGAIGLGGYVILRNHTKAQDKAFQVHYEKDFLSGNIKPLPSPYAASGSVDELQFRTIQLPKVSVQSMAFNGDLLCVRDGGTRHPKSWLVIDRDGRIKSSFLADRAYMTRTGKVASFLGDSENSVAITFTDTNGQKHHLENDAYATSITWTGPPIFTSIGFFDASGKSDLLRYHDLQLTAKEVPVPGGGFFVPSSESEVDGTVGNIFEKGGGNTDRLGIFKDGRISDESISIPHEHFAIVCSRNGIAVTSGRAYQECIPYRRTRPNQYERLAVPEGSLGATVAAINQRGDYILQVIGPAKAAQVNKTMPYNDEDYLVTNGKCYYLRHIHQMLFGTNDFKHGIIQPNMLDEYGDMVATTENGPFIIQPLVSEGQGNTVSPTP